MNYTGSMLILVLLGATQPAYAARIQATKPVRGAYQLTNKSSGEENTENLKKKQKESIAAASIINGYARYTNDAMGLTLEYPKNWKIKADHFFKTPTAGWYRVTFSGNNIGGDQVASISLQMSLHENPVSIDVLYDDFLSLYNFDLRANTIGKYIHRYVPNMSTPLAKAVSAGGYEGKQYSFHSEKSNQKYSIVHGGIPVENRFYRFQISTSPSYDVDVTMGLDHLLGTLEFREPTFTKSITEKAKSSSSARPTTNRRYK